MFAIEIEVGIKSERNKIENNVLKKKKKLLVQE